MSQIIKDYEQNSRTARFVIYLSEEKNLVFIQMYKEDVDMFSIQIISCNSHF